jgi:O-antigen/teichoic acid export membrane protein
LLNKRRDTSIMLIGDSIVYLIARFVPGILGAVTTVVLTRLLEPSQYGAYGLIIVIMTFVSNVGFDWLNFSFLRLYEGRRKDPRAVTTFVYLFLGLVIASMGLALLAWLIVGRREIDVTAYGIGLLLAWAYAWFELVSRVEIASFRSPSYLKMNIARTVLVFIGATVAAWLTHDPVWAAIGTGAGLLASAGFGEFKRPPLAPYYFDRDFASEIIRYGLPLFISLTLSAVVMNGNRILIEMLGSTEALGLYTAAFFLVQNNITMMASGLSMGAFQLAVRAVEKGDPTEIQRIFLENGTLLLAFTAPATLGMILTAEGIAEVFVGAKFRPAVTELTPWLAIAAFFISIRFYFFDNAFHFGNRRSSLIWVSAATAVITIFLSIVLIPQKGPLGAAIALMIAMIASCLMAAVIGRRTYALPIPIDGTWRVLLCCLVMAIAVYLVPGIGAEKFFWQVAAGTISYSCAAVALNLLGIRSKILSYL